MKKLTAGIFTVLLGLCASNTADAAVASAKWVGQQLEAKVSSETYATDKASLESAIGQKVAQSDYDAKISALESADSGLANRVKTIEDNKTTEITEDNKGSDALYPSVSAISKYVADITSGEMDTLGSLAKLSSIKDAQVADDAAIAQSKIANLTTDLDAKAAKSDLQAVSDLVGTTAVATQISNAITALNLDTTYATIGALNTTNQNVANNAGAIGENVAAIAAVEALVGETSVASQIAAASDALTTEINKKQDTLSGSAAIEIKDNVVSIITGAITQAMLAENSVDTEQLVDGAVTADKIDAEAVTNDKIKSVEQNKITGLTEELAKKITEPAVECGNSKAKCVLVYGTDAEGKSAYAWEVIERGTTE